jgi:nucleoside phosphorylase
MEGGTYRTLQVINQIPVVALIILAIVTFSLELDLIIKPELNDFRPILNSYSTYSTYNIIYWIMSLEIIILSGVMLQRSISRKNILQVRRSRSIFVLYIQLAYSKGEKAVTRFAIAAIINFIRYLYVLVFTILVQIEKKPGPWYIEVLDPVLYTLFTVIIIGVMVNILTRPPFRQRRETTTNLSIPPQYQLEDYRIGWICTLPLEMAAAKAMLDEIHIDLPNNPNNYNAYILGKISSHNIVVACLPSGVYGTTSAATVATQMLSSFKSIRFGLMVGIGGGVPSETADIRLGDIVVAKPTEHFPGVIQYDYGKTVQDGRFERTGTLNKPPQPLLTAVSRLQADHMMIDSRIPTYLSEMVAKYPRMSTNFTHRGHQQDRLFQARYDHAEIRDTCDHCDISKLVDRPARTTNSPMIHYGLIASGNQVMKHGVTRDQFARDLSILCFEMEAAGLMDNFPCLVIRGICDYADSHKNNVWQEYAAATAAAYAKEILSVIPPGLVAKTPTIAMAASNACESLFCGC